MPKASSPLVAFVALYTLGALVVSLATRNVEFVYYVFVLVIIIAGIGVLHARARLPAWLLWALAMWGFLHLLGGTLPIPERITEPGSHANLYNMRLAPWLPRYDQVIHACGFGVSTLAAWFALRGAAPSLPARFGPIFGAAMIGMGLGAMNEVIEFVATRLMTWTNVGGYDNTGWDLVSNLVGCTIAGAVIRLRFAQPAPSPAA